MIIGLTGTNKDMRHKVSRMILHYTMDPSLRADFMANAKGDRNWILALNDSSLNTIQYQYFQLLSFYIVSVNGSLVDVCSRLAGGNPWNSAWNDSIMPSQWRYDSGLGETDMRRGTFMELLKRKCEEIHEDFWLNLMLDSYSKSEVKMWDGHPDISEGNDFSVDMYERWIISDIETAHQIRKIREWKGAEEDDRLFISINGDECDKEVDEEADIVWNWGSDWEGNTSIDRVWDIVSIFCENNDGIRKNMLI